MPRQPKPFYRSGYIASSLNTDGVSFRVTYTRWADTPVPNKSRKKSGRLIGKATTAEEIQRLRHCIATYSIDPGRRDWLFCLATQLEHGKRPLSAEKANKALQRVKIASEDAIRLMRGNRSSRVTHSLDGEAIVKEAHLLVLQLIHKSLRLPGSSNPPDQPLSEVEYEKLVRCGVCILGIFSSWRNLFVSAMPMHGKDTSSLCVIS